MNKGVYLLNFLLLFSCNVLMAQFEYEWGFSIGAENVDRTTSMQVDKDGNVLLTGMYSNTVDFDPGSGTTELTGPLLSAFLSKYDQSGALIWARDLNMGTDQTSPNQLPDLDIDANGNSYVIGYLGNNNIESSIYFARYDAEGNMSWSYEVTGADRDEGRAVHALPNGDCLVAGRFSGTKDFNPGVGTFAVSSLGADDLFFGKYDKTGALIWLENIGGAMPSQSTIHHITSDQNDDIYIAGELHNSFDFDPKNATTNSVIGTSGRKAFIAKYTKDGQYIWAQSIGDIGTAFVSEILIDHQNDVLITGRFSEAIDLDPGSDSLVFSVQGLIDGYLAKYNSEGALIWGFPVASSGTDEGIGIAVDASDNVHLTGFFGGAEGIDLDPSSAVALLPNAGIYDMYYGLYDKDGNYIDAFSIGGQSGVDTGIEVETDEDGTVVIAGWYQSETVDFDVTSGMDVNNADGTDIFVVKYRHPDIPTAVFSPSLSEIKISPNPAQTNASIYMDLPVIGQIDLVMTDLSGRIISMTSDLTTRTILSPSVPGMYTLLFYKNGIPFGRQKLVVVK